MMKVRCSPACSGWKKRQNLHSEAFGRSLALSFESCPCFVLCVVGIFMASRTWPETPSLSNPHLGYCPHTAAVYNRAAIKVLIWVVVKIMVPSWVPKHPYIYIINIIQVLLSGGSTQPHPSRQSQDREASPEPMPVSPPTSTRGLRAEG